MIVKRMPPAIWNAGSVMPNAEKIAPPVNAKIARISAAAKDARNAIRRRSFGMPAVIATKIGAASIGLMTEKSEEKARTTNLASAEENMRTGPRAILERLEGQKGKRRSATRPRRGQQDGEERPASRARVSGSSSRPTTTLTCCESLFGIRVRRRRVDGRGVAEDAPGGLTPPSR